MAETMTIDESLLYPRGYDPIRTSPEGDNQTLLDLAIRKVKETIYADDRLDYQGSEIVTEVDKTGLEGGIPRGPGPADLRDGSPIPPGRSPGAAKGRDRGCFDRDADCGDFCGRRGVRGRGDDSRPRGDADVSSDRRGGREHPHGPRSLRRGKTGRARDAGKATPQQPKSIGSGLSCASAGGWRRRR